jgi:hypothetical protein
MKSLLNLISPLRKISGWYVKLMNDHYAVIQSLNIGVKKPFNILSNNFDPEDWKCALITNSLKLGRPSQNNINNDSTLIKLINSSHYRDSRIFRDFYKFCCKHEL